METDMGGFRAKMLTCIQDRGNITGLYDTGRYSVGYLRIWHQLKKLSNINTNIKYARIPSDYLKTLHQPTLSA
jgi:hypothetical protein